MVEFNCDDIVFAIIRAYNVTCKIKNGFVRLDLEYINDLHSLSEEINAAES